MDTVKSVLLAAFQEADVDQSGTLDSVEILDVLHVSRDTAPPEIREFVILYCNVKEIYTESASQPPALERGTRVDSNSNRHVDEGPVCVR